MSKDIDELRFVADLAHNGGMMQAENEYLKKDNAQLQVENERLKNDNMQLRTEIGKLKDDNRLMRAEMDVLRSTPPQGQPTVVVNNYYLLSMPKTSNYVRALDNEGRLFVGHFMHHTLSDGTPQSVIDEVDEMTQLEHHDEGHVVIQHNNGPVNGYITTQHVEMPALNADTTKMIENDE